MNFKNVSGLDAVLVEPIVHTDPRGFFLESFNFEKFIKHCGDHCFVQDNHSQSTKGVLRGLHYQLNNPQGKLVRVTRGEVYDVVVDLRRSSPNFGQWVGVYLNESNKKMLWVPPGFAHGFYVTSDVAEFQYKCTDYYAPKDQYSIRWNDPDLNISWPFTDEPIVSEKDQQGVCFADAALYT